MKILRVCHRSFMRLRVKKDCETLGQGRGKTPEMRIYGILRNSRNAEFLKRWTRKTFKENNVKKKYSQLC